MLAPRTDRRRRDLDTDVCVVGGGFAGLATALGLVERGKKVRIPSNLPWSQVYGATGTAAPVLKVIRFDCLD